MLDERDFLRTLEAENARYFNIMSFHDVNKLTRVCDLKRLSKICGEVLKGQLLLCDHCLTVLFADFFGS